ncbi:MAG TPA: DUF3341 domain-containing protein [Phycisphaerae bacterium]|jgi:hypothetical protein
MTDECDIYGLLAEFEQPEELLEAARRTHEAGYRRIDAYTPFPVHGLSEAIGFRHTRLPLVIFIGGVIGCVGGYFLQYYAAVVNYPVNIGGRPYHSWPAFIPVTFELTVLCAAFFAVFGMLGLNGLPLPYHPLFNEPSFELASRNRFFLCIESRDPRFDRRATAAFLCGLRARHVTEVPY